ncbi:hypothetical protein J6590_092313 [Homalodisca vitripennis]|nr:hypothetical protein J6590_092313 [Homalodisca vitripennis]
MVQDSEGNCCEIQRSILVQVTILLEVNTPLYSRQKLQPLWSASGNWIKGCNIDNILTDLQAVAVLSFKFRSRIIWDSYIVAFKLNKHYLSVFWTSDLELANTTLSVKFMGFSSSSVHPGFQCQVFNSWAKDKGQSRWIMTPGFRMDIPWVVSVKRLCSLGYKGRRDIFYSREEVL